MSIESFMLTTTVRLLAAALALMAVTVTARAETPCGSACSAIVAADPGPSAKQAAAREETLQGRRYEFIRGQRTCSSAPFPQSHGAVPAYATSNAARCSAG